MLRHTGDNMKPWQRPGLRRRFVFALLGVLVALSYALLLAGKEAQAKEGKGSPNRGSAEGTAKEASEPVRKATGEAGRLAGNSEAGREKAGSVAAREPAPRNDRPSPGNDGPAGDAARLATTNEVAKKDAPALDALPKTEEALAERTGRLGDATGAARDTVEPAVEPVLSETATVTGPALEVATRPPEAEPVLGGAAPVVEPILEKTAGTEITPVLKETASAVEPALAETLPVVEPILDEAISTAVEPVGQAIEPALEEAVSPTVAPPLEDSASPVGPALEEAALPAAEPIIGPVEFSEPVSGVVAPVAGSGFGEGAVYQNAETPVLGGNTNAVPVSPYHAPAGKPRAALPDHRPAPTVSESAWDSSPGFYDPVRAETRASAVEPPEGYSGLSVDSPVIGGSRAALPGLTTAAQDVRNRVTHPLFPSGFPSGSPPVSSSFLSSGAAGAALDLLAILALLPVLSRIGGSSRTAREAFGLGSSPRLAVERPG